MTLGWPQLTWLAIQLIGLGVFAVMHGKPRTGNYSVGRWLYDSLSTGIILYFGGFFG